MIENLVKRTQPGTLGRDSPGQIVYIGACLQNVVFS